MKILIIGNVANNAYLIAKNLRREGIEADVLCYDYFDIMGSPEWEDAEFEGDWGLNSHPQWHKLNLNGFERPEWFVQGSSGRAVDFLLNPAKRKKQILERECFLRKPSFKDYWHPSDWKTLASERPFLFWAVWPVLAFIGGFRKIRKFSSGFSRRHSVQLKDFARKYKEAMNKDFQYADRLRAFVGVYCRNIDKLMEQYDIVQGHATDGLFPLFYNKRPYIAFEHGTLRNIPFQDNFKGASTALTYKLADKVLITNCDNIVAAEKLGLDNFEFLPHPVNEDGLENSDALDLRNELLNEYDADYIVLHPARQHWSEDRHPDWEKGNDIFIKGFARFIQDVNPKAMGVFVEWGNKLPESKKLIKQLGVDHRIKWIKPMHHKSMLRHIKASDILTDQFYLGAFGSIVPKGLMCGRAVMVRLNEKIHEWAFPEPPPVLNVANDDDVCEKLKLHYKNKEYRMGLEEASLNWYKNFHSADVITNKLINIYKEL